MGVNRALQPFRMESKSNVLSDIDWGVLPLSAIAANPIFGSFGLVEGNSTRGFSIIVEYPAVALSELGSGARASQALPLVGDLRFASILVSSTFDIEGTITSPARITRSWKSSTTLWWLKNGAPNNRS